MPGLNTSEHFPCYRRHARARNVYNGKSVQRCSDRAHWQSCGLRRCAVVGVQKNASVARSGPFSPILRRVGQVRRPQLLSGHVLAGFEPKQTGAGGWRFFGDIREAA